MAISRRDFVLGSGAGLVLPSFYERAYSYFENHGEALLEPARGAEPKLWVDYEVGNMFHLGQPRVSPEYFGETLREFAKLFFNSEPLEWYMSRFDVCEEEALDEDFDAKVNDSRLFELWVDTASPVRKAYDYLGSLDLGPALRGRNSVGGINLGIYGGMGGSCYAATPDNEVSISLLQRRLNELNTGIKIVPFHG